MAVGEHDTERDDEPVEIYPDDLWNIIFPFPDAYEAQKEGIQETIKTATDDSGGYVVLEGACGTGKTLLAVVSAISLIRSPMTGFNRIFVATSVKQQLEAFEDDLDSINAHLKDLDADKYDIPNEFLEPVTALSLVGKQDVCPYKYSGHIDPDYIYRNCNDLQEQTDGIVGQYETKDEKGTAAEKLASEAEITQAVGPDKSLDIEDPATHPYPETPPQIQLSSYCPYYAQYRLDEITDNSPIAYEGAVLTAQRLTERSLEQGTCPYEAMKEIAPKAEVIIANYNHVLESQTVRAFTQNLMGDDTFLICDEAHTLIKKARQSFSKSATLTDLHRAIEEIDQVITWSKNGPPEAADAVKKALSQARMSPTDLSGFKEVIRLTAKQAEEQIPSALSRTDLTVEDLQTIDDQSQYDDSEHIPLRDPETIETDDISKIFNYSSYEGRDPPIPRFGTQVRNAIRTAYHEDSKELSTVSQPSNLSVEDVGPFIQQYYLQNHRDYYREAEVLPTDHYEAPTNADGLKHDMQIRQPVKLRVVNCIPAGKLSNTFDQFRSGVLMSATISPQWVYRGVSGLNYLDRTITELQYSLQFPKENRATYGVDVTKFTGSNRNPDYADNEEDRKRIDQIRDEYYEAIKAVVTETPGNVLVAGPAYRDAEWAADRLKKDSDVSKQILEDESSENDETIRLKEEFVSGEPKVLTTGMRGTLTEGVDYDGDALKAAAIFGVPIAYLGNPESDATKHAYSEQFSSDDGSNTGFQFAHGIPAIRKARQAIGRVIRSFDDTGIRVLIDERYCSGPFHGYLSELEQEELETVSYNNLPDKISHFWDTH